MSSTLPKLGETKEDRELREEIVKREKNRAPQILRQFEKNAQRKPQVECQLCVKMNEQTYPLKVEICIKCYERIGKKYGKIFTYLDMYGRAVKKNHQFFRRICGWCGNKCVSFFDVNLRSCFKCIKKAGRIEKFKKNYYYEAWGNKPLLHGLNLEDYKVPDGRLLWRMK